ncbi:LysR family transcriptional regulator [Phyllobacterium salinisoli]|uniref:LysR family transcriptional regulator n=1 Tax=Phyllobacterium salinisoli TaxID=1899321 RepID=A0A368JW10_9HYPH|nr:LysR family transcriptional regulator [Phyllobacterium salinisoli]RCS21359.1 LysR family transcriptional regulator [Phyllobacterium salinisoli]
MLNLSRKKLGVFLSVVEAGSFTKGARCSSISEPATISIINELESTLGANLFERTGKIRTTKLTPRGQDVYEILAKALAVYDQILKALHSEKRNAPKVLIQTPYASAVSWNWLSGVISKFDGRQIKINSAERQEIFHAIESRDECMAFIDGDARPKNSEYFPLYTSEIVMVASYSQTRDINFSDGNISWDKVPENAVLYSGIAPDTTKKIYENLKGTGTCPGELTEINCTEILRHFILELGAPALLPKIMAQSLRKDVDLRSLRFSSPVHVPLGLVLPYGQNHQFKLNRSDIQTAFSQGQ